MGDIPVDVNAGPDGTLVLEPHHILGPDHGADLRHALVHALRRVRPQRLVLDLHDITHLDPISLGTLAATCDLGDDQRIPVHFHHTSPTLARLLTTAGIATHRIHPGDTPHPLPGPQQTR